ncbi:hypothetical protein PsWM33_04463 [Pseudovibrio sp. WM33]|nr:hypothetical protein PsWM33_04463 [Pseudovibrio sp. WM33]
MSLVHVDLAKSTSIATVHLSDPTLIKFKKGLLQQPFFITDDLPLHTKEICTRKAGVFPEPENVNLRFFQL